MSTNSIHDSDNFRFGVMLHSNPEDLPGIGERRQLIQAIRSLNKTDYLLLGEGNEMRASFDPVTRRPVIKVVNRASQEVLFQIPPEYVLRLAKESQRHGGQE